MLPQNFPHTQPISVIKNSNKRTWFTECFQTKTEWFQDFLSKEFSSRETLSKIFGPLTLRSDFVVHWIIVQAIFRPIDISSYIDELTINDFKNSTFFIVLFQPDYIRWVLEPLQVSKFGTPTFFCMDQTPFCPQWSASPYASHRYLSISF